MPAGLGFMVQAILGMMGSQSLLHVGALSVRLSEGFHYKLSIVHRENNVTICQLYFFYLSQCQVKLIRVDNNIKLVNILWFPSRYYLNTIRYLDNLPKFFVYLSR